MSKRPTIADIAEELGLSKSAVSYALNGRPGVGEQTREQIIATATAMGWHASSSARALSGAETGVIGLILARAPELIAVEPYFMRLVSGIESVLAEKGFSLLLRLVTDAPKTELLAYRRWWGERRVDGVILLDERVRDPRLPLVQELGLPAVLCGGPHPKSAMPCLWFDERADTRTIVGHLAEQGHTRIAHVSGPRRFMHERRRRRAVPTAAQAVGIDDVVTLEADYVGSSAADRTAELLKLDDPPTAVVYGSDVMAVSGLATMIEHGVRVPDEMAVVSWDDSLLCTMVRPAISALGRDPTAYGARAAEALLALIAGGDVQDQREADHDLVLRASTVSSPGA